jgi:ABC-type Zn uptake system ZnuABC Zn-binding protein ZnuA
MSKIFFVVITLIALLLSACQGAPATQSTGANAPVPIRVLAVETFLADIAQNVAGDRLKVETLMPLGLDPHAFEPTPQDVAKIADCQMLIVNGAGFEAWLAETIRNAGGQRMLIEASAGLASRAPRAGEMPVDEPADPHFWLDPLSVARYVENIRDGFIAADPGGKDVYTRNAAAYIAQLNDLDGRIRQQVDIIPTARRMIITNHESFGYFADRYGFQIVGAIIPSVSTGASPSAQQLAQLVDRIRVSGVTAIFLETGSNPQLAEQIAQETGVKVVSDLYTHSITDAGGKAPTYIAMMKYNVETIVAALK